MVISTTGVLFKKAEEIIAPISTVMIAMVGLRAERREAWSMSFSNAPDWKSPCAMTKSAIMVINAGFEKPARISELESSGDAPSVICDPKPKISNRAIITKSDVSSIDSRSSTYETIANMMTPKLAHM